MMFGMSKKEMFGEAVTQVVPGFVGAPVRAWFGKDKEDPTATGKKEQLIYQTEIADIDISQREYGYQQEIQAPFTYSPAITKTYAPVFQIHSPAGEAGSTISSEAKVEFEQILTALQKLSQSQEADADISQKQDAEQSMKDIAGLPLTQIAIIGALGLVGYFVYKHREQLKKKTKEAARKHPAGKAIIKKEDE